MKKQKADPLAIGLLCAYAGFIVGIAFLSFMRTRAKVDELGFKVELLSMDRRARLQRARDDALARDIRLQGPAPEPTPSAGD